MLRRSMNGATTLGATSEGSGARARSGAHRGCLMRHPAIVATGLHVPSIEVPNEVFRRRFAQSAPDFVDRIEPASGVLTRW